MASLKITRASGEVICKITPAIEYAFEQKYNVGIHKQFADQQRQSDIYWIAWEALRRQEVVPAWGDNFLDTLISVEVIDDFDPNG